MSTDGQLKALERLAEYPQRVQKLKAQWIDVNAGGTRRSSSPSPRRKRDSSPSPGPTTVGGPTSRTRASGGSSPAHEPARARGGRSAGSGLDRQRAAPKARAKSTSRPARTSTDGPSDGQGPLTASQIRDLMNRDLSPEDYELLLLLDEGMVKKAKTLSADTASALPRATGTAWIDEACSICLCALEEDEDVRMLPTCGHFFHAPCAQRWLTSERAVCPVCGQEESKQDKVVEMFRKLDENGDGTIELGDLKRVLNVLDADFWDTARVERLFEKADADEDGKIDAADFITWLFADHGMPDLERSLTRQRFHQAA